MDKKQYVVCAMLGTTLMLCFSGCARNENIAPDTIADMQMETSETTIGDQTDWEDIDETDFTTEETENSEPAQTEPAQTETVTANLDQTQPKQTEPAATEPPQTEPAQTEPVVTEPTATEPPQTEPVQTEPVETEPAATEPQETEPAQLERTLAQSVINQATARLSEQMSKVTYDPGWSGGTVVNMPVGLNLSEDEMVRKLLKQMQGLFADAMAGEESQESVSYTYSMAYNGVTEDNSAHLFTLSYTSIGLIVEEIPFDSGAVIEQVTQGVLSSTRVSATAFDGSGYAECVTIREVPYFYSIEDAVDCLISAVEREIYTQNILGGPCSEFCLVYGSKEETCHVFLLYLK